jgi:hypothetical protein
MDYDKIAERATSYRPMRALLTVLSAPLYVLGFLIAMLWLAGTWMWAAAATGFVDARDRAGER